MTMIMTMAPRAAVAQDVTATAVQPAAALTAPSTLESLWEDLTQAEPQKQQEAEQAMIARGHEAVAFIAHQLKEEISVDATRLADLMARLDSDVWSQREQATETLMAIGPSLLPHLEAMRAKATSPEVRARLDAIDSGIRRERLPQRRALRMFSATRILEQVGGEAALMALSDLATQAPGPRTGLPIAQAAKRLGDQVMHVKLAEARAHADKNDFAAAARSARDVAKWATDMGVENLGQSQRAAAKYEALARHWQEVENVRSALATDASSVDAARRVAAAAKLGLYFSQPAEGLTVLGGGTDAPSAELRKILTLAKTTHDQLTAVDALAVAQWYEDAAAQAEATLRPGLLTQGAVLLLRVQGDEAADQSDRAAAAERLVGLRSELWKHDPSAVIPGDDNAGLIADRDFVRSALQPLAAGAIRAGNVQAWHYVGSWMIVGPFPNPGNANVDTAFEPENSVDLAATYTVAGRNLAWQAVRSPKPGIEPPNLTQDAVYYAYAEFEWPQAQTVKLAMGADDVGKVWLNGSHIWTADKANKAWRIAENVQDAQLRPGINRVLFRIAQSPGGCAFSLSLGVEPKTSTP